MGNLRPLHRYLELLEENCWPTAFTETLTQTEKSNEFLMLQLRQTKGLSLKKWEDDFAPKNWMDNHFDVLRAWQKEIVRLDGRSNRAYEKGITGCGCSDCRIEFMISQQILGWYIFLIFNRID